MIDIQSKKAQKFLDLHTNGGCFIMPNAWDAGSAKMFVDAGFGVVGTTSAGIAFALGRPDNAFCSEKARLGRDEMLAEVSVIARSAIDSCGIPFVLVGRTDCMNIGRTDGFAEAVKRANLYCEAGADCLFVPGVSDLPGVKRLVQEIDGPINVVMGLTGAGLSLSQLRDAVVRRVSIGGSLARAVLFQIREAAKEMLTLGTFNFAKNQVSQTELNNIFEKDL